jgi:hypothetical protein
MRIADAALKRGYTVEQIEHAVVHHVHEFRDQGDHSLANLIGPTASGELLEIGVLVAADDRSIDVVTHVMSVRSQVPPDEESQVRTLTDTDYSDAELEARFENFDFDAAEHFERDPLKALHWAAQFRDYADEQLNGVVSEARGSGATWAQIGQALGVSHQAAMKRYKKSA